MTVRPCEYRAGRANTKICLQRKGFLSPVRAGRLFPNLRESRDIGIAAGSTEACSGVVVEPNIEKSGSARTAAQNSRNPRHVRCSTVPAGLFWRPHARTDARTKGPAPGAAPIAAPAYKFVHVGGIRRTRDSLRGPSVRLQRERATHAAPTRRNAPAESPR